MAGLLALMLFSEARSPARTTTSGDEKAAEVVGEALAPYQRATTLCGSIPEQCYLDSQITHLETAASQPTLTQ